MVPTVGPSSCSARAYVAYDCCADVSRAAIPAMLALQAGKCSGMNPFARGKILRAIAEGIRARAAQIAEVETRNGGKTISNSLNEVDSAANVFEYYAGAMDKFFGDTIPMGSNVPDFTPREPLGVVAAITPWTFPSLAAPGSAALPRDGLPSRFR